VLVSARKLAELGVSDADLPEPVQVELAPRQLQAPELVNGGRAAAKEPDLVDDVEAA
ncbi:MAG TPA: DNA recombination protein RmuC, partial [Micromonosporaceae bacterium]|nr:DNA recombination protein RmuC [Micromonosporaceae bacterium]